MTDEAEVKKVYCTKCGYLTKEPSNCTHPDNLYCYDIWLRKKLGYMHKPEDMNCKNDCRLFDSSPEPVDAEE